MTKEERLKMLKEEREDKRKLLEYLINEKRNDYSVNVLVQMLTYLEREILKLSKEIYNTKLYNLI